MPPLEKNPRFTNPLIHSVSPYLRQHAHNPVFWYPWGREALDRARAENKPILLSVGYSTCYWCHVMEREVFENLSIASLMNRFCVNIKLDREEHPQLDDIYMVARQMLTQEGGWPNNVFLTPELKPFHAGGTYAPDESYGKPAFPRLLEWLNFVWTTQQAEVRGVADRITAGMERFLVYAPPAEAVETTVPEQARQLFSLLDTYHDERAGGFFQAPKFPQENYLAFLLGYHELTGSDRALDMVTRSLSRMASGGLYDQVGCGFHRYAVDKEWYVPHFEKMLYNQALLARLYTEAARLTGNPFFADIARSVLEFVSGPLTSGTGAFYTGIDAETDGVEGAYYVWKAEELKEVLTEEEVVFLTSFYALADMPAFPGHKHADGQVLIARRPLDVAARERGMPYVQLAAFSAGVLNRLLEVRNRRPAPALDDKIITGWNGLMMDAFATAGRVLARPSYTARAREAADFLLEHAIDNQGRLCRIHAGGRARQPALLEDYAFLVKGLISLHRASPEAALLTAATELMARAREQFEGSDGGYFLTAPEEDLLFRIRSADDSSVPGACGVMLHNLLDLHALTGEASWKAQAGALAAYYLRGNTAISVEWATLMHAALRLDVLESGALLRPLPERYAETAAPPPAPQEAVSVSAALFPPDAGPGRPCEVIVSLDIAEGWHINASRPLQPYLIPTQLDVQGQGVELLAVDYPEPRRETMTDSAAGGQALLVYKGLVSITARLKLPAALPARPALKLALRFQPCRGTACHALRDVSLTL